MVSDWRQSTWGDEISLEYGKALRGYCETQGRYRVFGSNGPIGWTSDSLTMGPGVILGRKGATRGVEYWCDPFWVIDTAYYVVPKTDLNMRWLYYAIKGYKLGEIDDGSPIPSTTRAAVYVRDIVVPPIGEQSAIAHILGTLDDKIELNRQTNETLEVMARALFKSWLVDFDPVRAKMDGRWKRGESLPGLPAQLYDEFPGSLTDSNIGKIPANWQIKSLDEIAKFLNGLALQKYPAQDFSKSLPVVKIAELRNGVSPSSDRASREIPDEYIIRDGDFLFSWSGSLLAKFWTEGEGALNQHLFKVTSNEYPIWFVSHWILQHLLEFQSIAASKATTMGHIQRSHLKIAMTVCPPSQTIKVLGESITPLIEKTIKNYLESRTLSSIRNTLLPKLISGELRIKDAERIIGDTI